MLTATEQDEYLAEIRREVCSRCIEKPPGGPPCEPLGKMCGIELHLPQLIDSIHQIRSPMIAPYLERNRREICEKCAFLHSSICPCPMDYLAVLLVDAVEEVDKHRAETAEFEREGADNTHHGTTADIERLYKTAFGSWLGCDWPTDFGESGLDLNNRTAADAATRAEQTSGTPAADDWRAAATWLACVERYAAQSNASATAALKALAAGNWQQALESAEYAWALEFLTGRPLRRGDSMWKPLLDAVKSAYCAHVGKEPTRETCAREASRPHCKSLL
jgi:hypothetical protein